MSASPAIDVVIPSAGRDSLAALLEALVGGRVAERLDGRIIVVDDRPGVDAAPLPAVGAEVILGPRRGPAAARNAGWRAAGAEWVAFLDDDVVPEPDWAQRLLEDVRSLPASVAGSQGVVSVPLPADRPRTDWERNVAGLERARWATADLAYRRAALAAVGGFDERFERAYREDSDLGLRLVRAGWGIERGRRAVTHPVRPADPWVSVRLQAGNADDVLMRALHGRDWRAAAGAPPGRLRRHLVTVAAGAAAITAAPAGRRRLALAGTLAWAACTAELAWARIAPGPRTAAEVVKMISTSAVLPAAAAWHLARGLARRRALLADTARAARPTAQPRDQADDSARAHPSEQNKRPPADRPDAVLLDRDGTLIVDVPYNGDPARVEAVPGARAALDRLRAVGLRLGVVSNQSGVARGLVAAEDVAEVNRRVEELLGPLGPWAVCPHGPEEGCGCRKPAPGLVLEAAARLGVAPERCAVIGDIGADVDAARAAGARGVLVPTLRTRSEEVAAAREVAPDLEAAVELLIGEAP
ncbi:MAG TPA: HAD-IIIA family hydrolase [Thermoleophilaceae bacterium]|nr:HAD-IIIA family hydrolase [Thermoleophilaceae bacterium]